MITAAADFIADQDAESVVVFLMAMCCLAIVVAIAVLIYLADRDRVHVDPCEHDFSDLPGFSREQLERVARMPVPPANTDPSPFSLDRSSPEVALRPKRAGTVSPIPSGGAGVSSSGARRGS